MRRFKDFVIYEFKAFKCAGNIIIALLFFVAAMYFVQDGSWQFKSILDNKDDFVKIEKFRVQQNRSYSQYGASGFRVMFIPSPLSVFFFNSGVNNNLTADLDVGSRLTISSSFKGRDAFKDRAGNFADFSGLFIFIGTLLVFLYGYEAFRQTDYLKFLSSIITIKKVFWLTVFARFFLALLFFLAVTAAAVLLVVVNGISLRSPDLLYLAVFFLVWMLTVFFFLTLGSIIGLKASKQAGLSLIVIAWLVLVYFIPLGIQKITATGARDIPPNYKLELEKYDHLMKFEQRVTEVVKNYSIKMDSTKEIRDLVDTFINNEYKKIKKIENDLEDNSTKKVNNYQLYSIFTPATFFANVREEMGGTGYENILSFFRYVVNLKHKFCMFYKEKKFYSDDRKVESFIKGDKNIYYAKSRLPNILPGIGVLIMYIIILLAVSSRLHKNVLYRITDEEMEEVKAVNLKFKRGEYMVGEIYSNAIPNLLFHVFSGECKELKERGFNGKILVDEADISSETCREDFLYLCKPGSLPNNLTIKDFIYFIAGIAGERKGDILSSALIKGMAGKKIKQFTRDEKCDVLLALAGIIKRGIYLINDIAPNMMVEFAYRFKDKMDVLSRQGAMVIYLTTDDFIRKSPESESPLYVNRYWSDQVDNYKKQDEDIKMK